MPTVAPRRHAGNANFRNVFASFLQQPGLPFADVLSAEAIEHAFRREGYGVTRTRGTADFELTRAGRISLVGCKRWKAARTGRTAVIPTPIVSGDLVYVTSGYNNGCNLFRVEKTGSGFAATQVYAKKDITNQHGGVVQIGDLVFGFSDNNGWIWQDLKTGDIVQTWPQKEFGKGCVSFADGLLYLRLERDKGTIVLLDPAADGVKVKGRFDQPDRSKKNSWPHPVVANGRLFIRDQDVLLAYDVKQK